MIVFGPGWVTGAVCRGPASAGSRCGCSVCRCYSYQLPQSDFSAPGAPRGPPVCVDFPLLVKVTCGSELTCQSRVSPATAPRHQHRPLPTLRTVRCASCASFYEFRHGPSPSSPPPHGTNRARYVDFPHNLLFRPSTQTKLNQTFESQNRESPGSLTTTPPPGARACPSRSRLTGGGAACRGRTLRCGTRGLSQGNLMNFSFLTGAQAPCSDQDKVRALSHVRELRAVCTVPWCGAYPPRPARYCAAP